MYMFVLGGAVGYKWVKEPLDVEGEGQPIVPPAIAHPL